MDFKYPQIKWYQNFRELPHYSYFIVLAFMGLGAWLCANDEPIFKKKN